MAIKFRTVESNIPALSENARCTARIVNNAILDATEMAREIAAHYGMDEQRAKYFLDIVSSYAIDALSEGKKLDFGPFSMSLTLKGVIAGANGAFEPGENSLGVALTLSKDAKTKLAKIRPINERTEGAPCIRNITFAGGSEAGTIHWGEKLVVTGLNLLTPVESADEGLWLCDAKSGKRLVRGKVLTSTMTTLEGIFEGDAPVAPGKYRLELTTRSGNDSTSAPAKCFRVVKVAG